MTDSKQPPLRLIDGKFYRGKEHVPLEFGNKEQIELIRQHQSRIEALSNEEGYEIDVDVEVTYEASFNWKCVCGATNHTSVEMYTDDDFNELLGKESCRSCRKEYVVFRNSNDDLAIKLVK